MLYLQCRRTECKIVVLVSRISGLVQARGTVLPPAGCNNQLYIASFCYSMMLFGCSTSLPGHTTH